MKLPLAVAVVILLLAGLLGWRNHRRIVVLRAEQVRLDTRVAAAAGNEVAGRSLTGTHVPRTGNGRRDVCAFGRELVGFLVALKNRPPGGGDEAGIHRQITSLLGDMLDLDHRELLELIGELDRAAGINDEERRNLRDYALTVLAVDHPEEALAIWTAAGGPAADPAALRRNVANCLRRWAARDPLAASAWLRRTGAGQAEIAGAEAQRAVVAGAARQDPQLALKLAWEWNLAGEPELAGELASELQADDGSLAMLRALREQAGNREDPDLLDRLVRALAPKVARDGFDAAKSWLDQASLTESERVGFAATLSQRDTKADTGRWIEWLAAGGLPEGTVGPTVDRLMKEWTKADYAAAGNWLNAAPAGAAKESAVQAFATSVAPYDAPAAARWAQTLPGGAAREKVLAEVHARWREQDPAAAAEFAREHRLGGGQ